MLMNFVMMLMSQLNLIHINHGLSVKFKFVYSKKKTLWCVLFPNILFKRQHQCTVKLRRVSSHPIKYIEIGVMIERYDGY